MDNTLIEYLDKSGQEYEIYNDRITVSISLLETLIKDRNHFEYLYTISGKICGGCIKKINELLNYIDNKQVRSDTTKFLIGLWNKE